MAFAHFGNLYSGGGWPKQKQILKSNFFGSNKSGSEAFPLSWDTCNLMGATRGTEMPYGGVSQKKQMYRNGGLVGYREANRIEYQVFVLCTLFCFVVVCYVLRMMMMVMMLLFFTDNRNASLGF